MVDGSGKQREDRQSGRWARPRPSKAVGGWQLLIARGRWKLDRASRRDPGGGAGNHTPHCSSWAGDRKGDCSVELGAGGVAVLCLREGCCTAGSRGPKSLIPEPALLDTVVAPRVESSDVESLPKKERRGWEMCFCAPDCRSRLVLALAKARFEWAVDVFADEAKCRSSTGRIPARRCGGRNWG